MTDRNYTEQEARKLALDVATQALALYEARPQKQRGGYSTAEAAGFLGVSTRTLARLNLPRMKGGKIAYEVLAAARAERN
jgi:hypothetical protein